MGKSERISSEVRKRGSVHSQYSFKNLLFFFNNFICIYNALIMLTLLSLNSLHHSFLYKSFFNVYDFLFYQLLSLTGDISMTMAIELSNGACCVHH